MTSCQVSRDEVYLIPEGFVGPVLIVFNQRQGQPTQYKEGSKVFEIPADGILETRFKALPCGDGDWDWGWESQCALRVDHYYLNDDGTRVRIPNLSMNNSENVVQIFEFTYGRFELSPGGKEVNYDLFMVGNLVERDSLREAGQALIERYKAAHR